MDPSLSINRGWQGRRGHYIQLNAVDLEIALKPETVEGCISQRQPFCVRVRGRGGQEFQREVLCGSVGARCARENLPVVVIH